MENIALIGTDLGKNTFHIHCQDQHGKSIYRKKLTRQKLYEFLATCPATTIVMEACRDAHFIVRKLSEQEHTPKLIARSLFAHLSKRTKMTLLMQRPSVKRRRGRPCDL